MKKSKTIFISDLIAGTLDAVAAILLFAKPPDLHNISRVFRFIASGLLGNTAYSSGIIYPLTGLLLHYLIAVIWSAIYLFVLYRFFKSGSVWAKTVLFASLIWIIMNGFVMPLCGLSSVSFDGWSVMRSFLVLLVCVSLPVCLIVENKI